MYLHAKLNLFLSQSSYKFSPKPTDYTSIYFPYISCCLYLNSTGYNEAMMFSTITSYMSEELCPG